MPLDKPGLAHDLYDVFSDINDERPAITQAQRIAEAYCSYVLTGEPELIITTLPGAVTGAMTAGPVLGQAIGGIDTPVGLGLQLPLLIQALTQVFAPTAGATAESKAGEWADALHGYFSQARVMTKDTTGTPVPCPPTSGPALGPTSGIGGIEQPTPGPGFTVSLPSLIQDLNAVYSDVQSMQSAATMAQRVAQAFDSFSRKGLVTTRGFFEAPAEVDPISESGVYDPGEGESEGELV
jgi:hypothetical protein